MLILWVHRNSTQNQVYFSTNTFPISRKCHLEKLSFHIMDILRSELQLENDMKIAISGDWLLFWWIHLAIQLKIKSTFQQIPSRSLENVILKNCLFIWWISQGQDFSLKMTWKEQFLEIGCLSDEFLWQFNSKSSLLFNKYLPDLQCHFEKLSSHIMDILRSELQLENDMKIAISGDWLLVWWIPLAI